MARKAKEKIRYRTKAIDEARDEIRRCEGQISTMQRSNHTFRGAHVIARRQQIKDARKKIAEHEAVIKAMKTEVSRLQRAPGR